MVGLLDIADPVERIDIAGAQLEVRGIGAQDIAKLLRQFPELRLMLSGKAVDPDVLIDFAPGAIAAIIAAGAGDIDDPKHVERAAGLSIDTQVDILSAILRLTMPQGFGPFVEKLTRMGLVQGKAEKSARAPATK